MMNQTCHMSHYTNENSYKNKKKDVLNLNHTLFNKIEAGQISQSI